MHPKRRICVHKGRPNSLSLCYNGIGNPRNLKNLNREGVNKQINTGKPPAPRAWSYRSFILTTEHE